MLTIENLQVDVNGKMVINGINLEVNPGEVHVIMGPNGAGKSTIANVLVGRDGYCVRDGQVRYNGKDLLSMSCEERALAGIFLAFQYPVAIPGVSTMNFLKTSINAQRKYRNEDELDAFEFLARLNKAAEHLGIDKALLKRSINEGFSGGEKKRCEILQMSLLEPALAILDEPDSGLDIDALQIIAKGVNDMRDKKRALIIITHYQRLLNHITPDFIHVLMAGKIVKSGGSDLADVLEEKGYEWLNATSDASQHEKVG